MPEGAVGVVHGLEDAEPPALPRVDRDDEDGVRSVAGTGVDARVEPRVRVRLVYAKQSTRPGHFGGETTAIERQADLVDREDTLASLPTLGQRA